jgi:uncharacterized RDD family membrane protein YckC
MREPRKHDNIDSHPAICFTNHLTDPTLLHSRMKKIAILIGLVLSVCSSVTQGVTRDVLAHSCGEWIWFAHVNKVTPVIPTDPPAATEQTACFALQNAPGQQWKALATIPGRAVELASRSSQLALLMADGTWLTVWEDGSATGQPLPAEGKIKCLTDDGAHLWAVGSIAGGISAAREAIDRESAGTQPTTAPATVESVASATTMPDDVRPVHSMPAKLVVFCEQNGRWAPIAELPSDALMTADEQVSLAVIDGNPQVSFKSESDKIRSIEYTSEHTWKDVSWISTINHQPIADFTTFSDGFKSMLWLTPGNDPGQLVVGGNPAPVQLSWVSPDALDGVPAVTFAGGYVAVFGPHNGKVLEQRYKRDGTAVDTAAEVSVIHDSAESLLPRWLEVAFLTSMGFSVGASVFRQWAEPQKGPVIKPPVPAPMLPRLAGGILDALPVIAAIFYLGIKTDGMNDLTSVPAIRWLIILGGSVVIYLLHTTLVEVFTGRSAGKWVFGLKVVTLEGTAPTKSQLLIRNLLRLIDPLLMIIVSPLAQRSADAVAGTMVVPLQPIKLPEPQDEDRD